MFHLQCVDFFSGSSPNQVLPLHSLITYAHVASYKSDPAIHGLLAVLC
ncbi:hypothetical protein M3J09_006456 [Ascochyta lentis]